MPAVHRLSAELYEEDFELIALHSRLEDYALAYALNLSLKTGFGRRRKDLDISDQVTIPIFEWKDDSNERYWTFFANYGIMEDESLKEGLFKDETFYRGFYMVPEYREADYFLKMEQERPDNVREVENQNLVKAIKRIPEITMAYFVTTDRLKSKNNLIF